MKRTMPVPSTRPTPLVYYVEQPSTPADLHLYTAAQVAARQRQDAALHARWVQRQTAIRERDRRVRHFLFGVGTMVGVGVLTAVAVGGWLIYRAAAGLSAAALVAGVVVAAVLIVGGIAGAHRCVTVVKHWH